MYGGLPSLPVQFYRRPEQARQPVLLRREVMPKLKTHKGAAKRFRSTASGKFKRGHSHARHILTKKTAKRKRNLDIDVLVSEGDQKRVEKMLPYGRD